MKQSTLSLSAISGSFALVRLSSNAPIPSWCTDVKTPFCSISRSQDELSIVCPEIWVPQDVKAERGWYVFKVEGPLDFSLTGVAAEITKLLAKEKIPLLFVSTYDTDYLLVQKPYLQKATAILSEAYTVRAVV